jgi:adenylate cyclase
MVREDYQAALQQYEKGRSLGTANNDLLVGIALAESGLGEWDPALEKLKQAARLDPRSVVTVRRLGDTLLSLRRYPDARETYDRALSLAPSNLSSIHAKAMTFLGEGNLNGARDVVRAASNSVGPTELVAFFATYEDLVWVLDESQRDLLFRLTASAFDDDVATRALCLTQAYALAGDAANTRRYAEEARAAYAEQARQSPDNAQLKALHGLSLAYLGRKEDAIREAQRATELVTASFSAAYYEIQLARVYTLVGEPEKAIDVLERVLREPGYISPGWLAINPYWDPLRQNPRFQKLAAGAK